MKGNYNSSEKMVVRAQLFPGVSEEPPEAHGARAQSRPGQRREGRGPIQGARRSAGHRDTGGQAERPPGEGFTSQEPRLVAMRFSRQKARALRRPGFSARARLGSASLRVKFVRRCLMTAIQIKPWPPEGFLKCQVLEEPVGPGQLSLPHEGFSPSVNILLSWWARPMGQGHRAGVTRSS